jgi:ribosomal protein L16 Arg81 hydroxylase
MNFAGVLDPIGVPDFFREYWDSKPLHIRGSRSKFKALPEVEALPRLLGGTLRPDRWTAGENSFCNAYKVNVDGSYDRLNNAPSSMFSQLFQNGYTLCFGDVSNGDSALSELVGAVCDLTEFRSAPVVTCYLTPPQSSGIVHYDSQHVFFLQRGGSKYWRVSESPGKKHPIRNFMYANVESRALDAMAKSGYEIQLPAQCGFRNVELAEGDVLYLPPGFYHAPHTRSEYSFHFTLTLDPICFWDFLSTAMGSILLRESDTFYCDLRNLDAEARRVTLEKQLALVKQRIQSLTVSELEDHLKRK